MRGTRGACAAGSACSRACGGTGACAHLAAFGHGEAPSQEEDDVPGHHVLSLLPRQQGLCLCVGSWAERRHSAWEGTPVPMGQGGDLTGALRTLSPRRGHQPLRPHLGGDTQGFPGRHTLAPASDLEV